MAIYTATRLRDPQFTIKVDMEYVSNTYRVLDMREVEETIAAVMRNEGDIVITVTEIATGKKVSTVMNGAVC